MVVVSGRGGILGEIGARGGNSYAKEMGEKEVQCGSSNAYSIGFSSSAGLDDLSTERKDFMVAAGSEILKNRSIRRGVIWCTTYEWIDTECLG